MASDPYQTKLAIKVINKEKVKHENLEFNSHSVLLKLDHPNIIKVVNIYMDEQFIYMALELCEGSVLLEKFPEGQVRELAYQMLCALAHLHEKRICHLDIKPSNFILKTNAPHSVLKLVDFEFVEDITQGNSVVPRGTLGYLAPELLDGLCSPACDMWSLGITLYCLLFGDEPFKGKDHIEVSMHAVTKKVDYTSGPYFSIF